MARARAAFATNSTAITTCDYVDGPGATPPAQSWKFVPVAGGAAAVWISSADGKSCLSANALAGAPGIVACSSCHKLHNNTTSPSKSLSEVHNGESPFSVHSTHRPAHLMPWTADRPKPLNLDDTSHAQGMKPLAPQHVVGDDACPSDTSKTLLLDPVLGGDPHPHPHCLSHLAHDDVPECLPDHYA